MALLQVIPQAGQRAADVQLGYRVEAGREVLGGHPLDADHVIVDDVHDPVRADPQPVIPASVESLCGVWIIGQGGRGT